MSRTEVGNEAVVVDTRAYLKIADVERVQEQLSIDVTGHCFQPQIDDLESDWVSHVAAPAFMLYREQRGGTAVESFCSIGTGSGLDVLSAIEILGASRVGLTDVHEDVVSTAVANVTRNISKRDQELHGQLIIEAGYGDLLSPLIPYAPRYDVIYENLPNIPSSSADEVAEDKRSSAYVPPRRESVPELVKQQMLDLHYLALVQAKDFLNAGGAVLSCLGARVPLDVFLSLGKFAGLSPSILTFGWKAQADPKLIRDYGLNQKSGFGPFHFYRVEALQRVFAQLSPAATGANALEIERELLPLRLTPSDAYQAHEHGERIGHTVAVLKSELR
jgi:hypothetical protein